MRRTKFTSPIRFVFDNQWQPLVRLEDYHRSGLGITKARELVEQQRRQLQANGATRDPYHTWHGRIVADWLDTLPTSGSTSATMLYEDFIRWAVEWENVDPADFSQTMWGRIMNGCVTKRRTNSGIVYDGVSLP